MRAAATASEATQPWQLDAVGQAALIAAGEVAPDELVRLAVERAERLDPDGSTIVSRRAEAAIEDAPRASGAFAGVPFAVKDWKCLQAGEPTWWGTRLLRELGHRAETTSVLAERYAAAGLVSIGRTALPELAFGPPTTEPDATGACRNPWDRARSVGGSSGGSAAAVAAGIVPAANASDGGGSLRIPAACCGLVGLKVSRGRITNAPHADGRGVKVEGHVARTVRDVAALLDVSAGAAPGDQYVAAAPAEPFAVAAGRPPGRLRIGVATAPPRSMSPDGEAPPAHVADVGTVASLLERLGHDMADGHPPGLDEPLRTPNLYAAERAVLRAGLERLLGRRLERDDVEPRTWALFELAASSAGVDVLAEIEAEQRWTRAVVSWWDDRDLLLTPTLGRDVPVIGELKETADDPLGAAARGFPLAWFTYPFNVTGQPAVVVPVDRGGGIPGSVQLVAAPGREDILLAVAAQLEDELGWSRRWPDGIA